VCDCLALSSANFSNAQYLAKDPANPSTMSDMGGMMDMGGMDMSSDDQFRGTNTMLAQLLWYLIAAFLGVCLLLQGVRAFSIHIRFVISNHHLFRP
jgi:hypothetical protein